MKKIWIGTALFWLVITSIIGLALRSYSFIGIPFKFPNILHAHSHLAFLGWVFTSLFSLIACTFIPPARRTKTLEIQFGIITLTNAGMIVSYILGGYCAASITFSSLHMFTALWFLSLLMSELKIQDAEQTGSGSTLFIKGAAFFFLLSSFGPLSLPLISKLAGAGTQLYSNAIYFYLHFQLNGWFTFSIFAILFKYLEKHHILIADKKTFLLLFIATIITIFSSLKLQDSTLVSTLRLISCLINIYPVILLTSRINKALKEIREDNIRQSSGIFKIAISAFLFKNIIQLIVAAPGFPTEITGNRNLAIAFLHLYLIGFVSLGIISLFRITEGINYNQKTVTVFIGSFVITEILISLKYFPALITHKQTDILLIVFSMIMAGCIIQLLSSFIKNNTITIHSSKTEAYQI